MYDTRWLRQMPSQVLDDLREGHEWISDANHWATVDRNSHGHDCR
jgi:hypothetical protein